MCNKLVKCDVCRRKVKCTKYIIYRDVKIDDKIYKYICNQCIEKRSQI